MQLPKFLPKTKADIFAFSVTFCGMNVMLIFELFVVLRWTIEQDPGYPMFKRCWHVAVAMFLYINSMGNFWLTIITDSSTRHLILPSVLKPGWRFCCVCEANAPPRSYHCGICGQCILKRDHHCVFTGNCIGINNHRHYMFFIFYCLITSLYCNLMNIDFMIHTVGKLSFSSVLNLILPLFMFVLGRIDFLHTVVTFLMMMSIATSCLLTALLGYHVINLYHGQTTYERTHNITRYNLGWKENIRMVFGDRWKTAWIIPGMKSSLPTDGLQYMTVDLYENPKDL